LDPAHRRAQLHLGVDMKLGVSRRLALSVWGASLLACFPSLSNAQAYPTRPITLLVGVAPGGFMDVQARLLAANVQKQLGQSVIVVNRAGLAGTLAPATLATQKADGYTLSVFPTSLYRLPHVQKVNFDPLKDFTYIINVTNSPVAVVVRSDAPWKNFAELLEYAKQHPGKISYGAQGAASTMNITMEQVARRAGVRFNFIPYKGSAEIWSALLGGHIDVAANSSFAPYLESGKGRALAVLSESRLKKFPNVPTVKDLGFGTEAKGGWGIGGPQGMDPHVVTVLHDAFKKAMDDPLFLSSLDVGDQVTTYMGSADYTRWVAEQFREEKKAVADLGFKVNE
jgi:tripartite-type tricarboxylate transporter receptor subunit TctC